MDSFYFSSHNVGNKMYKNKSNASQMSMTIRGQNPEPYSKNYADTMHSISKRNHVIKSDMTWWYSIVYNPNGYHVYQNTTAIYI